MKQCKQCGKSGIFLSLNADGLCKACAAKLEAEQLERRRLLIAQATAFIEDFSQHAQKAVSKSYVFPSMGSARIEEIERGCKYIQEHIDDWKKYPGFKVAFLDTLTTDEKGYTYSPLFPGRMIGKFFQDDLDGNLEKYFNELKNGAKEIYYRAISASLKAYDYSHDFTVAGVTFKNGRQSRQTILRRIMFSDPPYNKDVTIKLQKEEFEGEAAIGVYANGDKVGYISRDDLPWILERWNKYSHVIDYSVYGGLEHSYGMEIKVGFRN